MMIMLLQLWHDLYLVKLVTQILFAKIFYKMVVLLTLHSKAATASSLCTVRGLCGCILSLRVCQGENDPFLSEKLARMDVYVDHNINGKFG